MSRRTDIYERPRRTTAHGAANTVVIRVDVLADLHDDARSAGVNTPTTDIIGRLLDAVTDSAIGAEEVAF
jgi:hypothetical protein